MTGMPAAVNTLASRGCRAAPSAGHDAHLATQGCLPLAEDELAGQFQLQVVPRTSAMRFVPVAQVQRPEEELPLDAGELLALPTMRS